MKRLMAVVFAAICAFAHAQSGTSPNLVNITNQQGSGWVGATPYTGTGGGYSGGSQPGYNSTNNTIYFGYNQNTVAYTYAFSQALRDSGMTITGYNYSWDYLNQQPYNGTLSAAVNFASISGASLHSKNWTLGTTTDWTNVSGSESFANNGILVSNIANFSLSFTGKDARWWAGYYGPQVRNPSLSLNYTFDACITNPLSNPSCPGYAQALLTQQCTANPLYNSSCPGYAQALLTQQCTSDVLSNPQCPGYATAYLNYQCSVNPLYSTTCSGYEQAYFNQQCSQNPLYNTRCSGYAEAYTTQQCTANPLYSTTCSGYASAYFDQQCKLNGLYDQKCPNYATAYATKMLLEKQGTASIVATAGTVAANAPTTTATVSNDGTVTTAPSTTGSTVVDKALPPPATTANSAAAPAAPVQLQPPPRNEQPQAPREERKPEGGPQGGQPPQGGPQGGEKPQPTARQALAERRLEAAKREAVEKGKNLANDMGKAADMESQKQIQNVVIQAMGFTPGFDSYGKTFVPDTVGYKPFTVYNKQVNVDNRKVGWGLYGPSDKLHNDLVESQYKGN